MARTYSEPAVEAQHGAPDDYPITSEYLAPALGASSYIINLQAGDRPEQIAHQIRRAPSGTLRILLVEPTHQPVLDNPVRLRALKDLAAEQAMDLAVVSRHAATIAVSGQAHVRTFGTLASARRMALSSVHLPAAKTQRVRPHVAERRRRAAALAAGAERSLPRPRPVITRLPRPKSPLRTGAALAPGTPWWLESVVLLTIAVTLGYGLLAGLRFLTPTATITLAPATESVETTVAITADPVADIVNQVSLEVPARRVENVVEGDTSIATTGVEDAPLGKAVGKVTFINRSGNSTAVPEGTVVHTSDGTNVRFHTTASVNLPNQFGASIDVPIEAIDPGLNGNVGAFRINAVDGPLALTTKAVNEEPTQGGSAARANVVTQADKDRLKESLSQQLIQRANVELSSALNEGEQVITQTLKTDILTETYDHFLGEKSDSLSMHLSVRVQGLAVDMKSAGDLARKALEAHVPPVDHIVPDSVRVEMGPMTARDGDRITFNLTARGNMVRDIDTQAVRTAIAGKSLTEAQQILNQGWNLRRPAVVKLTSPLPEWLQAPPDHLPKLPFRIQTRILWSG